MSIKRDRIQVYDMTCTSCETRVEKSIRKLEGILTVKANYSGQFVDVEYDSKTCSIDKIISAIKSAGYSTQESGSFKIVGIVLIGLAVIMLSKLTQGFDMNEKLNNASYFVLFVVGILTSLHCVGMCGGIMLSQSVNKDSITLIKPQKNFIEKFESMRPAFLYNLGRVISYTLLGGLVGALGSVFSLSLQMQAGLQIFAAIFMIILGLNMSGFKMFRKLHIKLPWSACSVNKKNNTPFIVGLLNGLMPCGPLQTMQLYALGTGSAFKGAASMFIFALGTVPLMLTFGAISGLLSKGYTKTLLKFGGIFIIVLGLMMGQRGFALAGINLSPMVALGAGTNTSSSPPAGSTAKIEGGVQTLNMSAEGRGYVPNVLYVQKGTPVKWIIDGKQINSCNNEIVVPSLKKRLKLKSGENILEFTPQETGDINFSCWMGMIRGVIRVVDDLGSVDTSTADSSLPDAGAAGGCCGGGTSGASSSIYGDLNTAPTDTLVKKAQLIGNTQSFSFRGLGYEFDPLILVVKSGANTKLTFDLRQFDNPEGEFTIIDGETGKTIAKFTGKKDIVNLEYKFEKAGGYGILKDGSIISVIEAVDDIKKADIEEIRKKYLE
jgi:sulfite exporter TauE/SafE/plastocyanin domain-containing protein/copper chaperone CopZ